MARQSRITTSRRKRKPHPPLQASKDAAAQLRRPRSIIKKEDERNVGFSDLPPELRNIIYEYALRPADGQAFPFRLYPRVLKLDIVAFNLLNTCYAIRKEANGIFYSRNTFRIDLQNVPRDALQLQAAYNKHLSEGLYHSEAQAKVAKLRYELKRPLFPQALKAIDAKNLGAGRIL